MTGWFAEPQPDWPKNTEVTNFLFFDESDKKPISPELEKFMAEGKPPVVFTAGTAVSDAASFFKASAEACDRLNTRAVFLSRYTEGIPDHLPSGIFHCDYAPFSKLFPYASAVVHHGGIGTCVCSGAKSRYPPAYNAIWHGSTGQFITSWRVWC